MGLPTWALNIRCQLASSNGKIPEKRSDAWHWAGEKSEQNELQISKTRLDFVQRIRDSYSMNAVIADSGGRN